MTRVPGLNLSVVAIAGALIALALGGCGGSTGSTGGATGGSTASGSASTSATPSAVGDAACLVGRWGVDLNALAAEEERISQTGAQAAVSGSLIMNLSPTVISPNFAYSTTITKDTSQGITIKTTTSFTGTASAEYSTNGNQLVTSLPVDFVHGTIKTYVNGSLSSTNQLNAGDDLSSMAFNGAMFSCGGNTLTLTDVGNHVTWRATRVAS